VTEEDTNIEPSTSKTRSDIAWTPNLKDAFMCSSVQTNHYWT
jgi:hypothetical protein